MASWGRGSDVALSGVGTIDANTNIIVGANTLFTEEVELRNVVDLDGTRFVVVEITDDETMEVMPVAETTIADQEVLLSQAPKYLTVAQATTSATYVTVAEAQDANNRVLGVKTPGWTLYEEYGDGRRRVETLVAMKSTS